MEPAEYLKMDAAEDGMWWYRALHARLMDAVASVDGAVLDAGCGTGGLLAAMGPVRPQLRLFGVEWAAEAATRAARKSARAVARGRVNGLPFADASFQAVISADVLCHAAVDPAVALREFRRVLAPGGLLVLNMPAYAWLASAHDEMVHNARRTNRRELRSWLKRAGFEVLSVSHWNALLLPLMIVSRKLPLQGRGRTSDVAAFPPWLDAMFHAATVLERRLPSFPFGGSVLAVARRPLLEAR